MSVNFFLCSKIQELTRNRENFENIFLDLSKHPGRWRLADSGCAWKPSTGGDVFTIDKDSIANAQWSRASKGYELKVITRNSATHQLDGFQQEVGLASKHLRHCLTHARTSTAHRKHSSSGTA